MLAWLAWLGFNYVLTFGGDRTPYLALPKGLFTSALWLGAAAVALAFLGAAWHERRGAARQRGAAMLAAIIALARSLCGLLVLGVPMVVGLITAVALDLWLTGAWASTLPQMMVSGMSRFVLLALPLFVLAGGVMNAGGISARLFEFARALVGPLRGGLAQVNVVDLDVLRRHDRLVDRGPRRHRLDRHPGDEEERLSGRFLGCAERLVGRHRADDPAVLADDPLFRGDRHLARRPVPRRADPGHPARPQPDGDRRLARPQVRLAALRRLHLGRMPAPAAARRCPSACR